MNSATIQLRRKTDGPYVIFYFLLSVS